MPLHMRIMLAWLAVTGLLGMAELLDDAEAAEPPIRVVVWDEQQPTQKEAYDNFLGNCIADHLRVLDASHPLTAGLPATFSLPRTEMYDEPFHVPAPDCVLVEDCWEPGEWFRSVMVWELGQGRVIYIRPGHETFPIFKDQHMLRLIENAARSGKPTSH